MSANVNFMDGRANEYSHRPPSAVPSEFDPYRIRQVTEQTDARGSVASLHNYEEIPGEINQSFSPSPRSLLDTDITPESTYLSPNSVVPTATRPCAQTRPQSGVLISGLNRVDTRIDVPPLPSRLPPTRRCWLFQRNQPQPAVQVCQPTCGNPEHACMERHLNNVGHGIASDPDYEVPCYGPYTTVPQVVYASTQGSANVGVKKKGKTICSYCILCSALALATIAIAAVCGVAVFVYLQKGSTQSVVFTMSNQQKDTCVYDHWTSWKQCWPKCRNQEVYIDGTRSRTQNIISGEDRCNETMVETELCYVPLCSDTASKVEIKIPLLMLKRGRGCSLNKWSEWTPSVCSDGTQWRIRSIIVDEIDCSKEKLEEDRSCDVESNDDVDRECDDHEPVDCVMFPWVAWDPSICPSICNSGICQHRHRLPETGGKCGGIPCDHFEQHQNRTCDYVANCPGARVPTCPQTT